MYTELDLISEYQAAVCSMLAGDFSHSIVAARNDEIGKLGHDLNELARLLEKKFTESLKLKEISEEITSGLFLDDVLNRAYESFRSVIPYCRMGCALLSEGNATATACWEKTDAASIKLRAGYTASMAGSSLQHIIETGQSRILNDLEAYLLEHPHSVSTKLLVAEGMRSNLTCPLIAKGKPVGFLFFTSDKTNTYQDIHQDVFLQIAGQISLLVEKSQLYQQLYELNKNLLTAQRELQHQATHDALTGIYNRRAIFEHMEAQLARAKRNKHTFSVIMVDIDHFKHINDSIGHVAGDAVLKAVAARMKDCLREYDYIGRYGGEEFLVVLGDADFESAIRTADRLNQAVGSKEILCANQLVPVTISAGVAVSVDCAVLNSDRMVSAADHALYRAKHEGRNRVEVSRL